MTERTRARVLAATERCLERDGIRRTTMTRIAKEAGVSRAGLYKHFPDKSSLIVAALAHIDEQFWAQAAAQVSAAHGIGAQIQEAVRFARSHEPGALLLRLRVEEPDAYARTVAAGLNELAADMASFWWPFLDLARSRGEVRADLEIEPAAAWVLRIVVSLVTSPIGDDEAVHRLVEDFVVPSLRSS